MTIASHARLAGCLTLIAALAAAAPARAGLIVGTIGGQVTAVGSSVSAVAVGDPVVGSYSYDDSVVDGAVNPFESFSLSIGTPPLPFGLADLAPGLSLGAYGRRIDRSTDASDVLFFFLDFVRASELVGGPADSQSISVGIPQSLQVNFDFPAYSLDLSFTATPTVAAVPEPSSLALAGLGFLGVAALARRRHVVIDRATR